MTHTEFVAYIRPALDPRVRCCKGCPLTFCQFNGWDKGDSTECLKQRLNAANISYIDTDVVGGENHVGM